MSFTILSLADHPGHMDAMATWFHLKWGAPKEAYLESMQACINGGDSVPQWYVAVEEGRIIGGLGVIENDFHDRKDLTPNICAVYTEPDCRGRGVAGALLRYACGHMARLGYSTLYLLTDHTGFYERYGWQFLCMAQGDFDEEPSRMYVHYMEESTPEA